MKLKYLAAAPLLYYSPVVFAGGADVFSNTEGKIITLYRENNYNPKYYNKKQDKKNNNKLAKQSNKSPNQINKQSN